MFTDLQQVSCIALATHRLLLATQRLLTLELVVVKTLCWQGLTVYLTCCTRYVQYRNTERPTLTLENIQDAPKGWNFIQESQTQDALRHRLINFKKMNCIFFSLHSLVHSFLPSFFPRFFHSHFTFFSLASFLLLSHFTLVCVSQILSFPIVFPTHTVSLLPPSFFLSFLSLYLPYYLPFISTFLSLIFLSPYINTKTQLQRSREATEKRVKMTGHTDLFPLSPCLFVTLTYLSENN